MRKLIVIAVLLLALGGYAQDGVIQSPSDPIIRLTPTTVPAGLEGTIYYNAASNLLIYHNGTAWVSLSTGGAAIDVGTSEGQLTYWNHSTQTWETASNIDWAEATQILTIEGKSVFDELTLTALTNDGAADSMLTVAAGVIYRTLIPSYTSLDIGTAEGQVAYWDHAAQTWTPSNASEFEWDDATQILTVNEIDVTDDAAIGDDATVGGTLTVTETIAGADLTLTALSDDGSPDSLLTIADGVVYRSSTSVINVDSVFYKVTAYDTLTVGFAAPDEKLPVLQLIGDADDDPEDVTEILTITLDPNTNPTKSKWDITSTQGDGYNFDKNIYSDGSKFSAVPDFTLVSDNDLTLQGDILKFRYQSDVLTGTNAFDFDQSGTSWELNGTGEQCIMSIQAEIDKASGNYIGIMLDATETQAGGSTNELMALRVGGVDQFTVSNAGDITSLGAFASATVNTGQGDNELYDMDQNVLTTSNVTFGTVTVTTTLSVGGSINNDCYGTMGFADSSSTLTMTQNNYAKVTNAWSTLYTTGVNSGLTFTGDSIQVPTAGDYYISWDLDYSGANTDTYHISIFVNNVRQNDYGTAHRDMTTSNVGTSSASTILTLAVDAWISLRITNEANDNDATINTGNITVQKKL